jgi:four helix bundle protein
MLDHERLDVYQTAIQFLDFAFRFVEILPRGHASLGDQLRRAATSIPLNIAEAAGRAPTERAQFHRIARGSAMECGAIVDVVRLLKVASSEDLDNAKKLLERTVSMLTKMCR